MPVPGVRAPVPAPAADVDQQAPCEARIVDSEISAPHAKQLPQLPSRELCRLQSQWLSAARIRLLRQANICTRKTVVDLGTGWGDVAFELRERSGGEVFAIDALPLEATDADTVFPATSPCNSSLIPIRRLQATAEQLPLADNSCDLVFTQCTFLWIQEPVHAIHEIARVLQPGGALAAVEPDYGGMMEHPPEAATRKLWRDGLRRAGADPDIGRKLPDWLRAAGFQVNVSFLDRLEPAHSGRFAILEQLPLTELERETLDRAKTVSLPTVHLPFWLIHAEVPTT